MACGPDDVTTDDDVLRLIVSDYTREAGVRQLERELGTVLREDGHAGGGRSSAEKPVIVDAAVVLEALGRPKFYREAAARTAVPGVATGLAVTGVGGDVLFVEAASMAGKGGLVLTGQLGDVMKESAPDRAHLRPEPRAATGDRRTRVRRQGVSRARARRARSPRMGRARA